MNTMKCSECGGRLEEGFVLDRGQHHGTRYQESWVQGKPERSFWTGIILRGKVQMPVATYRCERCGLLRSYAQPGA